MKEFVAGAVVTCYDELNESTFTDHILISEVESYADAMNRIENYFGNTIESVEITLISEFSPFISVNSENFDSFLKGKLYE